MKKINVVLLLIAFVSFQKNFAGSPRSSCLTDNFRFLDQNVSCESSLSQVNRTSCSVFSDNSLINCDDLQEDETKSKNAHDILFSSVVRFQSGESRQVYCSISDCHKPAGKLFILNSVFRL